MTVSNGIITPPIADKDPYTCMGVGKYNGWWDIAYICSNHHNRINRWAKYKPERTGTQQDITEDQRRSNMYGFSVPKITTASLNPNAVWQYLPPVVGSNWCRLNDFNGYNIAAVPPIEIFFPAKLYSDSGVSNEVYFEIDDYMTNILPDNNVLIRDIFYHYRSYYFGVIAYNRAKNQAVWRTIEHTLSAFENGENVEVPLLPVWVNGDTIEMFAILSQTKYVGAPADAPPLDHDAFFMQHEAKSGYASAVIGPRYPVIGYIKVVGNPTIVFSKVYYQDEYHWHITEMRMTLTNTSPTTLSIKVHPYIEVEDTADTYEFPTKTTSVPLNGQVSLYFDSDHFIPSKFEEVYVNIQVQDIGVAGYGGSIFTKYFNFATKVWRDI